MPARRDLGALAAALCLAACGEAAGDGDGAGVLLLVVDGLRADHLSTYGYDRDTAPVCDALATEGWLFRDTFAASPLPIPAHAALLSGCDPNLARRRVPQWLQASPDQVWRLPAGVPRLAIEFAVAGFRTACFADGPELAPVHGFAAGFQRFESTREDDDRAEPPGIARNAGALLQWLRGLPEDADWFATLHAADLSTLWLEPDPRFDSYYPSRPELNYVPPVGSREPALFALPPSLWSGGPTTLGQYEARYDGRVRRLDEALGQLLGGLAVEGRLAATTVCVVGAHGLQFGEAGLYLDHGRFSLADLRVPWLLRPAPALGRPAGRLLEGIASTVDVAPTLLALHGLQPPPAMQGVSQLPQLEGATPRSVAFASCGIQGGYAAFDSDLALEVLIPGEVADPGLARAWFGDGRDHSGVVVERVYDWREQPFPPLAQRYGVDRELGGPLRDAAVDFIDRVERQRLDVQREWLLDAAEDEGTD